MTEWNRYQFGGMRVDKPTYEEITKLIKELEPHYATSIPLRAWLNPSKWVRDTIARLSKVLRSRP